MFLKSKIIAAQRIISVLSKWFFIGQWVVIIWLVYLQGNICESNELPISVTKTQLYLWLKFWRKREGEGKEAEI